MMKTKLFFLSLGGVSLLSAPFLRAIDRPELALPEPPVVGMPSDSPASPQAALVPLEQQKPTKPTEGTLSAPSAPALPSVWLGIVPMPMPPALLAQLNLSGHSGLLVRAVGPESPAKKAGVQEYDVLLSVNEVPLRESKDISRALLDTKAGQKITLEIIRGMKPQKLEVLLEAKPSSVAQVDALMDGTQALEDQWNEQKEAVGDVQKRIIPLVRAQRLNAPARAQQLSSAHDVQSLMADSMAQVLEQMMGSHADLKQQVLPLIQRGSPQLKSQLLEMQQALDALEAEGPPSLPAPPSSFLQMSSSFNFRISDGDGTILLQKNNGKTHLKVTDSQGKLQFEGPYETEAEKKALPEAIRQRMEKIQIQE